MTRKYSTVNLCECGCGRPARVNGKYHADGCRTLHWQRIHRNTGGPAGRPRKPEAKQPSPFTQPDDRPRCKCGRPLYGKVCVHCTPKQVENKLLEQARQTLAAKGA